MTVKFNKYQGTGNDFVMIDNRLYGLDKSHTETVKHLCNRHFGIGADGLIYLQQKDGYDFEMVYFNSDGNESTMCGNGGRCLIQFAAQLGVINGPCRFWAVDGEHEGEVLSDGRISLKMKDVDGMQITGGDYVLNTGSPHYVRFVPQVSTIPVKEEGARIRYSETYSKAGVNVNFVELRNEGEIFVRTYERGVEDETLSCGTGVVASALAYAHRTDSLLNEVQIQTFGGNLSVKFEAAVNGFKNIYLIGPAQRVFEGTVEI